METLEIQGKRYIKASSAARETGYTMDYIGQLCRRKKIDAVLVGRTWYVRDTEITEHRRTRGRSSSAKVREHVQKAVAEAHQSTHYRSHASPRRQLLAAPVTYHRDDEDLIPTPLRHIAVESKDTERAIHTGGEVSLSVALSSSKEAHLQPVRKTHEDVKWNGTIVVSPLQDDSEGKGVSDAEESTELEAVSTDRSTRVKIRVGEIDESINLREDTEEEEEASVTASDIPNFAERLNHAHVLNAEDEDIHRATIIEEETIHPQSEGEMEHTTHAWTYTMAGFVVATCFVFAATNMLVEQVIYVDSVQGSQDLIHSMSRWYGLVSINAVGDGAANIVSAIRDMAQIKGD